MFQQMLQRVFNDPNALTKLGESPIDPNVILAGLPPSGTGLQPGGGVGLQPGGGTGIVTGPEDAQRAQFNNPKLAQMGQPRPGPNIGAALSGFNQFAQMSQPRQQAPVAPAPLPPGGAAAQFVPSAVQPGNPRRAKGFAELLAGMPR